MTALIQIFLAGGYGMLSALVPVLNAEAYAVLAAHAATPVGALVIAAALAVGQTAGKLTIVEAARRGSNALSRRRGAQSAGRDAPRPWAARITRALRSRRSGVLLVLGSALVGLPPLAAVSVAAGLAGQRRWEFALACLAGRFVRFAALATPTSWWLT
ncbi:MAG: hypothetical protein V9G19_02215 [Tetrasphaera sp.]